MVSKECENLNRLYSSRRDELKHEIYVNLEYFVLAHCQCEWDIFVENAGQDNIIKFLENLTTNVNIQGKTWDEVDDKYFKPFAEQYI